MSEEKISTGSAAIDELLGGGFERGTVTQLYGAPGSGKTNIAMSAAVSVAAGGEKAVVIDSEGLSMARVEQLMAPYEAGSDLSEQILTKEVYDFAGQKDAIESVTDLSHDVDLVVVDSITGFYRLERDEDDQGDSLREVARQITKLLGMARKYDIAVVVTNQVYSTAESEGETGLGGNTLNHWTGTVLRVADEGTGARTVGLEKHRALETGVEARFRITDTGLEGVSEGSGVVSPHQ